MLCLSPFIWYYSLTALLPLNNGVSVNYCGWLTAFEELYSSNWTNGFLKSQSPSYLVVPYVVCALHNECFLLSILNPTNNQPPVGVSKFQYSCIGEINIPIRALFFLPLCHFYCVSAEWGKPWQCHSVSRESGRRWAEDAPFLGFLNDFFLNKISP